MAPSRGTPRQTFRVDPELWATFGEATQRLDPPADRAELIRQFMRWFVGEKGAKMPRRPTPEG